MKTVFSNAMCAHVWAQQSQPHGHSGAMKFDGAVAYSYAEPVAHIAHTPAGARVALFTSKNWSPTTGRHLSEYRSAVPSGIPQFTVPDIFWIERTRVAQYGHDTNVKYLRSEYAATVAKLMRAQCDGWSVANQAASHYSGPSTYPTNAHDTLYGLAKVLADYSVIFQLGLPPLAWSTDADAIIARRDRLLNDPKRQAKAAARVAQRAAADAKQHAADYARNLEYIEKWRAGEIVHVRLSDEQGGALLRIALRFRGADTVQTSMGAEVPIAHAERVYRNWLYACLIGRDVTRDDASVSDSARKLGNFRLDSMDAKTGTIVAGCHTIHRAEIERLAIAAGWRS